MKKLFICLTYGILLQLAAGCTKVIDLDLNQIAPKVVVEGLVSDTDYAWVRLTKTSNYYDTTAPQKINNALVIVSDNAANQDTLRLLSDGLYKSTSLIGVPGRTYSLRVIIDGNEYKAQTYLAPLAPLDSLGYKYYAGDDAFHKKGYYPLIYFTDPPDQENYYMLIYYKNNQLLNKSNDLQITDDKNLQSSIKGYEIPYTMQQTDTFKVVVYSLSPEVFDFYQELSAQLNNDGGMFSSPPANAHGNVTNGALGCFQASSVKQDSIIIK